MLGMKVLGSNSELIFSTFFMHLFSLVTALLEYLDLAILHLLVYLLYNFVAVSLLLF